jgi:2-phospho-L-lactate guanylyltransferase
MILIPVKNLAQAKQRLADALDQPARTELAQAMLLDVLEALAPWTDQAKLNLVTSDPFALDVAKRYDLEVIPDAANSSETDAIEMATQVCVSRGAEYTLVLPADIPLIQSSELEAIFSAAPKEGSVLVPAADGRGTNAVWRRPAGLFPLRFGDDSFQPHRAAAEATRKPCVVLQLPGIALDIDNSSDLRQLANSPGETRSQRLARKWGLTVRTQAAAR